MIVEAAHVLKNDCAKKPYNLFVMKYDSRDAMTTKERVHTKLAIFYPKRCSKKHELQ